MLAERLDAVEFHALMGGLLAIGALLAIVWALWDNRCAMAEGDPADAPLGDVAHVPDDVRHLIARRRFERMDGVL
ncbi:hypothetical protein HL667_33640 [Bradyrhizobium sp. 83012]|uniref:Uncharacterized protein n=1 Tax=Bradyrhizobium aeschynomenes TaxID=2734909 RepID=A0ABX2CQ12_9BRAD|nr:hypothetical protein [Bradyrhizobium aeschynomenes]NPU69975.1 hypothetical protein [Bradyrhizobium aeschynomenes]